MNDGDTRQADPLIGQMVGEYRIENQLGSGGMGIVYRGTHSVIGKPVAIKILRSEGDAEHTSRLLAEARTVSALRHRGIADIFGFGTLPDGRPYIVMELLEGKPLDIVLRDRGTMTVGEALWVLEEALGPLAAAHGSGVIHRDIKPSNFFISEEDGGSRYLKILDFGLAKRRSGENLTAVGSVLGTPDYMSPEQAQARAVGPAADIYSLGATMFELLTGTPPFVGPSPMEIMIQHVHNPAPKVSEKVAGVSPEIDELIAEMLEKDPAKRLSSAQELKLRVARLRKKLARESTAEFDVPAPPARAPAAAAASAVTQHVPARPSAQLAPQAQAPKSIRAAGPQAAQVKAAPPRRAEGGVWKWAALAAGVIALGGLAAVLLVPSGESIPTRPPEGLPVKDPAGDPLLAGVERPVEDEPPTGALGPKRDAGALAVAELPGEEVRPVVPTKAETIKRKPPPIDKSVEARIKRGELALRARAKRGDGDPIAAQFLKTLKEELKKSPASRQKLSKDLDQWERTYLR